MFGLLIACVIPQLHGTPAFAQRDGVADALAGHAAEMRQLGEKADVMRRPLFFDPVDIEGPESGVPCDHLAVRRPEVVAGRGWVVLMETRAAPSLRLRFWLPPGRAAPGGPEAAALSFAKEQTKQTDIQVLASRNFAWCR